MAFNIIVKNYEHINRSFRNWDTPKGKYIRTKKQYDEAMAREGMVPYEEGQRSAKKYEEALDKKKYGGLSPKASALLKSVHKDKKGKIRLSGKQVEGMKEVGVHFNVPDWCPKHYMDIK